MLLMIRAAEQRRAARLVEQAHIDYAIAAAAQGGKKAFGAFRSMLRDLMERAGHVEQTDAEELARRMGLRRVG
jgi:hypothetical protein